MSKVKLSELPSDAMLSYEDAHCTYTPGQLIEELKRDGDLAFHTWYVAVGHTWAPDAKMMVDDYIETASCDMYEDWYSRAKDCLEKEHYERIQAVLNEVFNDAYVTQYWLLEGPEVIIDTLD